MSVTSRPRLLGGDRARVAPLVDLVKAGHARVRHPLAGWQRTYRRQAFAIDLVVAAAASLAAASARNAFVGSGSSLWNLGDESMRGAVLLLPAIWVVCLIRSGAYAPRYVGAGPDEYRAVTRAVVVLLAVAGVFSYAFQLELARGFVGLALPFVLVLTLVGRYVLRARLYHRRARGEKLQSTVVVGRADSVADMIRQIRRQPETTGLKVVGACVSGMDDTDWVSLGTIEGVPLFGGPDDTLTAVDSLDADVVAVASDPDLVGPSLRRLGWSLEQRGVDLLVAPGIVGVAGPRLSLRPAQGLSMLHVERPLTQGFVYQTKAIVDRFVGALLILAASPVLLLIALAIRLESRGPALFTQERIGDGGRPFTMYKFRTMVLNAEALLAELAQHHDGNETLFKMREDPRVTRVGRFLRKHSLDELPQLINVVKGDMSLVGPRPPLGREVDTYEFDALRRLRVRPGMTGLWQVSGRSDLSWEDSVRLDLWYVDNWSMSMDAQIIFRTARTVLTGKGAY